VITRLAGDLVGSLQFAVNSATANSQLQT